jgi:hypothetical protein
MGESTKGEKGSGAQTRFGIINNDFSRYTTSITKQQAWVNMWKGCQTCVRFVLKLQTIIIRNSKY